ncbi:efflux RND transporter permease subunit [Verrucomicrobiales bacterium BCK34]|nr:efflux RND transporter permease subunit [Verrucomicrobiales bacterium BCK34]
MSDPSPIDTTGPVAKLIRFCLTNKLIVLLITFMLLTWGVLVAPFDWEVGGVPRSQVPVDAIPDIGENQQIIFTEWMGRSPQDVEDQITFPLTTALLGIPEVKTIRSYSYFGFSSVYIIFKESAEWDWSRAKILEKLNSLPAGTLPENVSPALGPDATALGQVFWYTLEGRDKDGNPAGGWDPQELRSIQDFYVRYALQSTDGVAEVASVGGFLKEYQIDVNPDAMRAFGVTLEQIFKAVKDANLDVGARTIEINRMEYVIRSRGFLTSLDDLRETAVAAKGDIPITLDEVADVSFGPALRRGVLDKAGAEAVGGVVVARYGANPMETIKNVKESIASISAGLPSKTLEDGTVSQVTIVPFYDRTGLINETLDTLNIALVQEILITVIVVLLLVFHLRSSLLISFILPGAVLLTFVGMKMFHVDANVVALSGIAIAIGTIVDMGIVLCENVLRQLEEADDDEPRLEVIFRACAEVGGAVLTAVMTTVISFLPVFAMEGAEGKLFKPLAYTKTFALIASVLIALTVLPPLIHMLYKKRFDVFSRRTPRIHTGFVVALALIVAIILGQDWMPLGPTYGLLNSFFVLILIGVLIALVYGFIHIYEPILRFFLRVKLILITLVLIVVTCGVLIYQGLGKEFMPSLNEGSFLYMPTTMPHASIGEAKRVLQLQDQAINAIPEVEMVVGKIGRVDSSLDPAPVSMVETVITYKPEWGEDKDGNRMRLWRDHIQTPDDIWKEIVSAAELPGVTSAPKLQPIETRIVMLQTGMRAPMGLKVYGPDLETIESVALELEAILKGVGSINPATVFADRVVGKPYLEININRKAISRYNISIRGVQDVIEVAVGGKRITTTVEGRERYPVRVRYQRERRDSIEELTEILVPAPDGRQIPLGELAEIKFIRGPQAIKSEDTFLVAYVIFDKQPGNAEVSVVEDARKLIEDHIESGDFVVPAGVSYQFTGSYENQVRAEKRLALILPLALMLIFILIYLQFRVVSTSLLVFSGIFVAWSGGFMMIWLYNQGWFMDFTLLGIDFRELFQIKTINLSVAVWVGFLALFGIATDDGVIMATYLQQKFKENEPASIQQIRESTVEGAMKRVRPAMMTTVTTLLALIPVLTSTGRGSDVMVPMAIPSFGGMTVAVLTVFVVPTLYCGIAELKFSWYNRANKKTNLKNIEPETNS